MLYEEVVTYIDNLEPYFRLIGHITHSNIRKNASASKLDNPDKML